MIAEAQPANVPLSADEIQPGSGGYVRVVNPNDFAVDVSGWKLSGGGVQFTFVSGTVIPAGDAVYVTKNIWEFKNSYGGKGFFVVGPLQGEPSGAPSSISISSAF